MRPLTQSLLPNVPWYIRWSGWMNNRRNCQAYEALLAEREPAEVMDIWWRETLLEPTTVQKVLDTIGENLGWKHPLFIPQDEWRVVLKLWWSGFFNGGMEQECCIWTIENIFGRKYPLSELPTMTEKTLGQFLEILRTGEPIRPGFPYHWNLPD